MKLHVSFDHRWFALGSLFSLFSLFAFVQGEWVWLMNLMFLSFLLYLVPARWGQPAEPTMSGGPAK